MTKQEFIAALRLGIPVYCTYRRQLRVIDPHDRDLYHGYIIVRDKFGTDMHSFWDDQPEAVDTLLGMYKNFTFDSPND